ncbi:MAG: hypothetical protein JRF30_10565 [Deltaproteobacteria bacterium]|nr:hypothetical protein [Deltaproteobacteria bacterium]MBW2331338.1 hypothetical protein [Deltaproteobacteria bacterium]
MKNKLSSKVRFKGCRCSAIKNEYVAHHDRELSYPELAKPALKDWSNGLVGCGAVVEDYEALCGTLLLPFEPGDNKRIAVKIVDDRGIKSLKILEV